MENEDVAVEAAYEVIKGLVPILSNQDIKKEGWF